MRIKLVKDLLGRCVITSDAVELGDVAEVELELSTLRATWIFIRLRRSQTHAFGATAPFVSGAVIIALTARHVLTVDTHVRLATSMAEAIDSAVVEANESDDEKEFHPTG